MKIEDEVMSVYRKVSPSTVNIEESERLKQQQRLYKELFQYKLKIPLAGFGCGRVLDLGCGTGEVDIILAEWGATVEGVDLNEKSILRARILADKFAYGDRLSFHVGNVLDKPTGSGYDFAISIGVIAHVADQDKLLSNLASSVKRGGFVVLGYIERSGIIQRWLHREIIQAIAKHNENDIETLAMDFFGEHIERAVVRGGRTAKSVIHDYLVNPHYQALRLPDLMKYFQQKGFRYYSSFPNVDPMLCINSPATKQLEVLDYQLFTSLLDLRWLFTQSEDEEVYEMFGFKSNNALKIREGVQGLLAYLENSLNIEREKDIDNEKIKHITDDLFGCLDVFIVNTTQTIKQKLAGAFDDLKQVVHQLSDLRQGRGVVKKPEFKHLFHGYNGLGTSYLVFILDD